MSRRLQARQGMVTVPHCQLHAASVAGSPHEAVLVEPVPSGLTNVGKWGAGVAIWTPCSPDVIVV